MIEARVFLFKNKTPFVERKRDLWRICFPRSYVGFLCVLNARILLKGGLG